MWPLFWVPKALMPCSILRKALNNWRMLLGQQLIGGGGGVCSQSTQSNKASQFNANLQVVSVKEHVSAAGRA